MLFDEWVFFQDLISLANHKKAILTLLLSKQLSFYITPAHILSSPFIYYEHYL